MGTNDEPQELKQLLSLTQDDILERIGIHLLGRQALRPSRSELLEDAKHWFEANLPKLQRAVCPHLYEKVLANESDIMKLAMRIADIISSLTIGVPVFYV